MSAAIDTGAIEALVTARHGDPFAVLGAQRAGNGRVVRTLQPQAATVELLDRHGKVIGALRRLHPDGLFEGPLPARMRRYALRVTGRDGDSVIVEDPYRFAPSIGEVDRYLLAEGSHQRLHATLGATPRKLGGVTGTRFAVWAPNAGRVSVVGTFNDWDARRHPMRLHPGSGVWEIFLPGVGPGALYKFDLLDAGGQALPQKCDPVGSFSERPPGNASIVYETSYQWGDADWMARRRVEPDLARPLSIYEVHLGSWRRRPEDGDRWLTYRELADQLIPYAVEMGFTHLELMPITEHPFDGSWGYQPTGMFAPTSRFGTPDDFRYLVDRCHRAGLAVIVDWVAAHFPRDDYGLARFDGTALYEHADPRRGEHGDWGTLIYNYGRREVENFLLGSALCWIDEFHIDGLRVDAVASMLYLDYSRTDGAWLPNEHGGNENLEAVAFLQRLNVAVHGRGAVTFAEESTAWPGVSRPTYDGGLGFTYKWNMGWMNDTLRYMSEEPVHRKYHHDKMTFGPVYAFTENFVLPLSHDEVVHGKKSLLGRMPGDEWQRFANLRAYLGSMFAYPGKKLLFMGAEFAQEAEWNHDRSLDWHLTTQPLHAGMQRLVTDLNRVYARTPALHEIDFQAEGFEWIDWQDADDSVLSWIRHSASGQYVICIVNFTPVVRYDYCIGVPEAVRYVELCNTDDRHYGGSGRCPFPPTTAECRERHDRPAQLTLTLPPLATVYLMPERQAGEMRTRNC